MQNDIQNVFFLQIVTCLKDEKSLLSKKMKNYFIYSKRHTKEKKIYNEAISFTLF